MVQKKTYPQLPAKEEYCLTEIEWWLMPIIDAMNQWGDNNRQFSESVITQYPRITQTSKSACHVYKYLAVTQKIR